jgi:hypothetical protein
MTQPAETLGKGGCPGLGFPYHGKPVANHYTLARFRYGLENAVKTTGQHCTSLFQYRTILGYEPPPPQSGVKCPHAIRMWVAPPAQPHNGTTAALFV